jgi:hypothetical protein
MTIGPERHHPAAYLADNFIVEILSRLPTKQLCRLKCVCRSWHDLIFCPVHRLRLAHTDAPSGFLYHHIYSGAQNINITLHLFGMPSGLRLALAKPNDNQYGLAKGVTWNL